LAACGLRAPTSNVVTSCSTWSRPMDEVTWLASTDPTPMLDFLRRNDKLPERKALLFVVACCRGNWPLITDERSRGAVEVTERYADREGEIQQLRSAAQAAWAVFRVVPMRIPQQDPLGAAYAMVSAGGTIRARAVKMWDGGCWSDLSMQERVTQACLLRDLFGNPFKPLTPLRVSLL